MVDRRRAMMIPMLLLLLIPASGGATGRGPKARGFPLFESSVAVLDANRVACGINNVGELCVDGANSPSIGGGFWPDVNGEQYVFNSGWYIGGIISGVPSSFAWFQDTVGAFFFNPRGTSQHGRPVAGIFNSLNAQDRVVWPSAARLQDPALFDASLLGRPFLSDQDTWLRYWDFDGSVTSERAHPAGLLMEQRSLAFDMPGLEDVLFFVMRLTNISARDPAAYQGLNASGYGPAEIAEIAALGARFQDDVEAAYQVAIPDGGYAISQVYAAFGSDPDVTASAGNNFSTANLVMEGAFAYSGVFQAPSGASYPVDIFGPPFAAAPGFVMNAFVQGPLAGTAPPARMAMWGNNTGGGAFPDSRDVQMHWRRVSLNLTTADGTCSVPNPQVRRFCFGNQAVSDTRYWMSAGPFNLLPGRTATFIMAQVHAAPLRAPLLAAGWPGPVVTPGLPIEGTRLVSGADVVRNIDRIAGWVSHADLDGDGEIERNEVTTAPRSLYHNFQRAAAVAASGFITPAAPEAPAFFVVPGDRRATIVWERSTTETSGDPFFPLASNPLQATYDPNYRRFDVEGYRVWRGTSPQTMQIIAQFDYTSTAFVDVAGRRDYGFRCAPEHGITAGCPAFPVRTGIFSPLVQIPAGGRLPVSTTEAFLIRADTAVTGGGSGLPALAESGVPFVFTDTSLINGELYYYAVTAFDVNSVMSAKSSMESPRLPRSTRPRASSAAGTAASIGAVRIVGGDGTILDSGAAIPAIDPATGIFSGPAPATNGLDFRLIEFIEELADSGIATVTIDSVVPGSGLQNPQPGAYFVTGLAAAGAQSMRIPITMDAFTVVRRSEGQVPVAAYDSGRVAAFRGTGTFTLEGILGVSAPGGWRLTNQARAGVNLDPANSIFNGPRWWSGSAPNEASTDPNGLRCNPPVGTCVQADLSRNAGTLGGVTTLFHISSYSTVPSVPMRELEAITMYGVRAADFRMYWGANGVVDSVVDLTHRVRVPFHPGIRASWGFLNDSSFVNTAAANTRDGNNALLTWSDITCVDPAPRFLTGLGAGAVPTNCGGAASTPAALMPRARLTAVAATSSTWANVPGLTATGNGFILYLNGHFFLMQLPSLPAAGTIWNARFYAGNITGTAGSYAFVPAAIRPPAVPGLRLEVAYQGRRVDLMASVDSQMARIHTVPDPFYLDMSVAFDQQQRLQFVNLPPRAIVRIYSSSGVLVAILNHNDPTGGGEAWWDLKNRGGRRAASGLYFYHVEAPDGRRRVGRFVIVYQRPGLN